MTGPADLRPVVLTTSQARRIIDLLLIVETLLSALRARAERGNPQMLASLEEFSRLLTGGGDTSQLISDLEAVRLEVATVVRAQRPQ